ncbi:hypothetical protein OUZ56_004927 [Daphnia magna]|uniref:Uncharacterized protein n=1 Tax=Daphnia magna TaxID=35525 RepID=A0ABQ9YRM4_9CRUS|nr:hypothetical protein OUZ56_004927 [Daphnia magna]
MYSTGCVYTEGRLNLHYNGVGICMKANSQLPLTALLISPSIVNTCVQIIHLFLLFAYVPPIPSRGGGEFLKTKLQTAFFFDTVFQMTWFLFVIFIMIDIRAAGQRSISLPSPPSSFLPVHIES